MNTAGTHIYASLITRVFYMQSDINAKSILIFYFYISFLQHNLSLPKQVMRLYDYLRRKYTQTCQCNQLVCFIINQFLKKNFT
jgi:hypothetical protein